MSKQTKNKSVLEAITNTVVGLFTSFSIQLIIYPMMGIPVTFSQNIVITVIFFIVSFGRSYALRRLFNRI